MKRLIYMTIMLCASLAASAQKTVYIPQEWRQQRTDTLLYKESDPDGKYTWSRTRSVESDNVIILWDKFYTKSPKALAKSDPYYVDIDDLLEKCEAFYDLEINQLGFVNPETSNLKKYKVMVLMNHTKEWACYGGGYDYQVPALWLSPSTCKPVGSAVAHEVGHSFHYMCYAEHSGHKDSQTDNTGFHLRCGNGQSIWEQTAQWQSLQSYPQEMYSQSINIFRNSHNYAYSHEWHRYQSYWMHYYLSEHYNDITTVAQVWNQPMTGQTDGSATDFNQALMKLKGMTPQDLFRLYFDYACHLVTWDLEACRPYRTPYIGDFNYRCVLDSAGRYQVALGSCPQGSGFNVIPLQVPSAGTTVTTRLTGLAVGSPLLDTDPGEYLNGESQYEKITATNGVRRYVGGGSGANRGFRMGYVALMDDGERRYFSEDSVYCQGAADGITEEYSFTVPEGVSQLWLVVAPALKRYTQHRWDDTIKRDDMWPYSFSIEGTDLGPRAIVYSAPVIDGRSVGDATFTYNVKFPCDAQGYSGTSLTVSGLAASTLGTALQMQPTDIAAKMQEWSSQGPSVGRIMFYAVNPSGTLAQSASTANGYGHWFSSAGRVIAYPNGYVYSEFNPSALTFQLGQYPGRCKEGSTYTIRQALRYRMADKTYATATFVFNITIGGQTSSALLHNLEYANPDTQGIDAPLNGRTTKHPDNEDAYDLQGRLVDGNHRSGTLYIQGGKKHIAE